MQGVGRCGSKPQQGEECTEPRIVAEGEREGFDTGYDRIHKWRRQYPPGGWARDRKDTLHSRLRQLTPRSVSETQGITLTRYR